MKLFAQHGFSDGLKTVEGLRKQLIDGIIFSPRDITPEKLRECASKITESAPISERLFDPQYYATLSAFDPLSRTGYLKEEYSCYFVPRRYDQLLRESEVIEDVLARFWSARRHCHLRRSSGPISSSAAHLIR